MYRTHTSREPCTNSTSSIAHPLEQNAQEAESYTHGQVHTCSIAQNTELTQAESHAPIVQAQSHTHLNKTLKRQRAIHMDRYTHAQSHRTHTSREPCTDSTSSIAHPLEQNAQEAESYTWTGTHMLSRTEYRTDTSREPCTDSTSSIACTHLNKTLKRQRAIHMDRYTHAQLHTCMNTELTQAGTIVQAQSHTHLN